MLPFPLQAIPLQSQDVEDAIDDTIADVVDYLPLVIAAILILAVGYVVGRILGGIVTNVLRRIGVDEYAEGTAMGESGESDDAIARAIGKIVAYYVYFVALFAAVSVLGINELSELLADVGAYLPLVLAALAILIVGFVVGTVIGDIVADLVSGVNFRRYLSDTPLEQYADEQGEFGRIVGILVTYYVYLLTLVAAADVLKIDALSELLNDFAAYLPALAAGLIVLLVGIWLAERVADMVRESGPGLFNDLAALATKILIYYLTIVIVLDTIGIDASPLTGFFMAFFVAFFGALALALASGAGVALGLGGQDFVQENIDDWYSSARRSAEQNTDSDTDSDD
jgi:small-conductance mechanosensitive channel